MKSRIIVVIYFLLSAMPVFSFAQEKKHPDSNVSAHEHTHENVKSKHAQYLLYKKEKKEARVDDENAKFKRTRDLFYSEENKRVRAEKLFDKRTEKETEAKKKVEEAQDKGEGQFKVKF